MSGVFPLCVLAAYSSMQEMLARGVSPGFALLTLDQFFQTVFLPLIQTTLKSWQTHVYRYQQHISAVIGGLRVRDIKTADLIRLIDGLRPSPRSRRGTSELAVASKNRVIALIKRLFSCLHERGYIDRNPALALKMQRERNKRGRILNTEEIPRFFAAVNNAPALVRNLLWLLVLTGLRMGEALGARWSYVDFERSLIRLPDTKSGRPRQVPLSDEALTVCHHLKSLQRNEWLFPGQGDGHLTRPTRSLKAILEESGIENFWIHDLRRQAGSIAGRNSPISDVSRLLGHADSRTTETYVIVEDKHVQAATANIGRVFTNLLPAPDSDAL